MGKLFKKLLRDTKGAKGKFVAIILVIAVGAFFYTGANMLADGLSSYIKDYYKTYNLGDLYAYFYQVDENATEEFSDINGINKVEARYTLEASHLIGGTKTNLMMHSLPEENTINVPMMIEGGIPDEADDIIIDSLYAEENDLKVGDTFPVSISDKEVEFVISGFCENVEHAYNIEDATLVVPDHSKYGAAYFTEKKLEEINGAKYFNEFMIDCESGADVDKIIEEIEDKADGLSYLYALPKEKMTSYLSIDNSIIMNSMMSVAMPMLLLIVAAVILFMTMSRTIDTERTQIGIMKSLGVRNKRIIMHYITYAFIVGTVGSIVGALLGFPVFNVIGVQQMQQNYSLPGFSLPTDITKIIPVVLCSIIFGVIASYLSCRKILKENPSAAMRPKPPKKAKKILIERIVFIWKRLSNSKKIIFRNIFLSKKRAFCTAVGVILCVVLLVVAFGYSSSLEITANTLIDDVNKYDMRVDYNGAFNEEEIKLSEDVDHYYSAEELYVQLTSAKEKKDTQLIITDKENDLIKLYNTEKDPIKLTDQGVVISKSYADAYDLSVGNTMELKIVMSEYQGKSLKVRVDQISLQYTGQGIYCTPAYLESLDVDYQPTVLLIKVKESGNIDRVYDDFAKNELVGKITKRDSMIQSVNTSIEQSYPVVFIFILCAVILSSAAIYTISSINISERYRDIATLKVLGYPQRKINRLIFLENIILTIFSALVALPLGIIIYKEFTKVLSTVDQVVPESMGIDTILLSVALTLAVTILSNLRLRKRVRKIDMLESLKSVE